MPAPFHVVIIGIQTQNVRVVWVDGKAARGTAAVRCGKGELQHLSVVDHLAEERGTGRKA